MELGSHVFCKGHYYRIKLKTKWSTLIPEKHIVKQASSWSSENKKILSEISFTAAEQRNLKMIFALRGRAALQNSPYKCLCFL